MRGSERIATKSNTSYRCIYVTKKNNSSIVGDRTSENVITGTRSLDFENAVRTLVVSGMDDPIKAR